VGRPPNPKIEEYKHVDGTTSYRVRVRVGGRQTTETFESRPAAEVFRARVMDPAIGAARAVALRAREDAQSDDYVPTVTEMLDRHLKLLTGVEGRTKDDYLSEAKRSWLPVLGPLRVDEVTRQDVADWVNAAEGTVKPKTIRNRHAILSAVLETAVHDRHITHNPARGTRLPRTGEEDVEEIRFLEYHEFDRLYAEIPDYYKPLVLLLFGTGLRWSEATALQVGDISQTHSTLRVVRAWKKAKKPETGFKIGPPKSKKSRRTIRLPLEVLGAIQPLLLDRPANAWLFTTQVRGTVVRHNNFYNRVWKPACIRAELNDPRPRIHDARHTHASWLIAQGVRLEVVQHRLGHEDYTTTARVYAHLLPDLLAEAELAADAAFASTTIRALPPAGAPS
jgi:integrase